MSINKDNYYEMDEEFNEINPEYYYMPPMFRSEYDESDADNDDIRMAQPQQMPTQIPMANLDEAPLTNTVQDQAFTQGFLKTLIGKRIRATFLIGTQMLTDRVGILTDVGVSYIVINPEGTNIRTMCDLYAIKFVDIYE